MTEQGYDVGVDLGGTNLKLALIDGAGRIIERSTVPTLAQEGHEAVLGRMAEGIRQLAAAAPGGAVGAVGVGVPGVLDMATGVTRDLPNLPGKWVDVPVGPILREATGYEAHLLNDVRAFTVGEHALGAAKGAETAACFAVGTGIGGGLVTHGKVHFGLGGAAGELGHQIVLPEGPRCTCGNRGCVEPLANGPGIVGEAVRRVLQGFTTELGRLAGGNLAAITPALVAQAAADGDEVAIEVLERAGYFLGLAVASTIASVAPEVVVIGGGVAQEAGPIYWRAMEETARSHSHVTDIDRIAFKPAALGYDAGVIGAALWGRERSGIGSRESGVG